MDNDGNAVNTEQVDTEQVDTEPTTSTIISYVRNPGGKNQYAQCREFSNSFSLSVYLFYSFTRH